MNWSYLVFLFLGVYTFVNKHLQATSINAIFFLSNSLLMNEKLYYCFCDSYGPPYMSSSLKKMKVLLSLLACCR